MANPENEGAVGDILASYEKFPYRVEAKAKALFLRKKFPPVVKIIDYERIASVEHKRLVDYGRLVGAVGAAVFAFVYYTISYVKSILGKLIEEVESATSLDLGITGEQFSEMLGLLFVIIALYYAIRFISSFQMRLVIYRTGKRPVALPFSLTGDALKLLEVLHQKVQEAGGISKVEAEQIVGNQIRSLLEERATMQNQMIDAIKSKIQLMKTEEDIEQVKQLVHESIDKLESHDKLIDVELKKTGLSKDDIFKKYHLRAPKEEFIDSVLKDEELEHLMDK